MSLALALVALASLAATAGCSSERSTSRHVRLPVSFVPTGVAVIGQCRVAARTLGYAVPCPTLIPRGLVGTPIGIPTRDGKFQTQPGCKPRFPIAGLSPCKPISNDQKNWIFGSSQVALPREHLVIRGSPRPINDYATALGVEGLDPSKRVKLGGWITLHGWRARWVFVPVRGNESIFLGHVALVWTTGRHTYAVGFHDWNRRAVTKAMDVELLRSIRMVAP